MSLQLDISTPCLKMASGWRGYMNSLEGVGVGDGIGGFCHVGVGDMGGFCHVGVGDDMGGFCHVRSDEATETTDLLELFLARRRRIQKKKKATPATTAKPADVPPITIQVFFGACEEEDDDDDVVVAAELGATVADGSVEARVV